MTTIDPTAFNTKFKGNAILRAIYRDIERLPLGLRGLGYRLAGIPAPGKEAPTFDPLRAGLRDLALLAGFSAVAGLSATLAVDGAVPVITSIAAIYASLGATGRLRRASVGHVHEAGHGVVTKFLVGRGWSRPGAKRVTRVIMDVASAISLTQNGDDYKENHDKHHREDMLGTLADPDGLGLKEDGFWSGAFKTRAEFYRKLIVTIFNPMWHLEKGAQRLNSNVATGKFYRRLMGAIAASTFFGSAFLMPLPAWLMAIGLPWTVFYNAASLLQVLTKHTYGHEIGTTDLADYARRCHERIPFHLMPRRCMSGAVKRAWAWTKWGAAIAFIDLPSRLTVLDSTMIGHGWHHMAWPSGHHFNDWTNTAHRMVEARLQGMPADAHTLVLTGLEKALARQAAFMSSQHS